MENQIKLGKTTIRKLFPKHGTFTGTVVAFNNGYYKVRYDDGGEEEMSSRFLLKYLQISDDEINKRKLNADLNSCENVVPSVVKDLKSQNLESLESSGAKKRDLKRNISEKHQLSTEEHKDEVDGPKKTTNFEFSENDLKTTKQARSPEGNDKNDGLQHNKNEVSTDSEAEEKPKVRKSDRTLIIRQNVDLKYACGTTCNDGRIEETSTLTPIRKIKCNSTVHQYGNCRQKRIKAKRTPDLSGPKLLDCNAHRFALSKKKEYCSGHMKKGGINLSTHALKGEKRSRKQAKDIVLAKQADTRNNPDFEGASPLLKSLFDVTHQLV